LTSKGLPGGHRVLVVEDDPGARAEVAGLLAARGDTVVAASSVEEAVRHVAADDFCLAIVDLELPFRDGQTAFVSGGEAVMRAIRSKDDRRNDDGRHVTPVLVVTGYLRRTEADRERIVEFFGKLYELGADAAIEKPLDAKATEKLLDKIRIGLENAGRARHAACAGLAIRRAPVAGGKAKAEGEAIVVVVDGERKGKNTGILANGERCFLQDNVFVAFLHLAVAHQKGTRAWLPLPALGAGRTPHRISKIRVALRKAVGGDAVIVENDGNESFRLEERIVIESVRWDALEGHPEVAVQKLAKQARKGE
jgi:CheY-like chemotaxis protein